MKPYLIIIIILAFCGVGFGQTKDQCNLSLENSPSLRNFKLGMSEQDVAKTLGKPPIYTADKTIAHLVKKGDEWIEAEPVNSNADMKYPSIDIGVKTYTYSLKPAAKLPLFEGVNSFSLSIYNNKVYQINVQYDNTEYKWKDAAEFTYILSDKLKLPQNAWEINDKTAAMGCSDFAVFVVTNEKFSTINLDYQRISREVESQAREKFLQQDKEARLKLIEQEKLKNITDLDKKKAFKP